MGRRSRRQRDATDIASPADIATQADEGLLTQLTDPVRPYPALDLTSEVIQGLTRLSEVSDSRFFHPEALFRPALDLTGHPSRIEPRDSRREQRRKNAAVQSWRREHPVLYQFQDARRSVICARRAIRKEVLIAERKHKRRGGGGGRRRSPFFDVKC